MLRVNGAKPGFYRYLPLEHQLLHLFDEEQIPGKLTEATLGQAFVGRAAVVFIWTAIPYRMEWRYGLVAHKVIAWTPDTSARIFIWRATPLGRASPWRHTISS